MSGIIGSKFNHRGSGLVASLGTDGQHMLSSGAGKKHVFETVATATFDDNKIINDISALAIRQATGDNASIGNYGNTYVDVMQDDTGVNFTTTSGRNSTDEYLMVTDGSTSAGTTFTIDKDNYTTYIDADARIYSSALGQSGEADFNEASDSLSSGSLGTKASNIFGDSDGTWAYANDRFTDDYRSEVIIPLVTAMRLTGASGKWRNGAGSSMAWHLHGIAADGYTQADPASYPAISQASGNSGGMSNGTTYTSAGTWDVATAFPYLGVFVRHGSSQTYMYDNLTITGNIPVPSRGSATAGVVTSNAVIPSSAVTNMGAVITYTETGTNTLNTDIILQLSADNGSNYTTATLTALPNFATGVKMAKVNDVTVTSGSQMLWKLTWANQASDKLCNIKGVSLQY